MIKLSQLVLLFSIILFASSNYSTNNRKHNIKLITDLQEFYDISSAIIIYNGNENKQVVMEMIKDLSRNQRYSIGISLLDIDDKYLQMKNHPRSLFVILLNTISDYKTLTYFSRENNLLPHVWLLLFKSEMYNICNNLEENDLNLNIASTVLVICNDNLEVMEWYAISSTSKLRKQKLFEWREENGLDQLGHPILYERRRNLTGISIRVPYDPKKKTNYYRIPLEILNMLTSAMNIVIIQQNDSESLGIWNKEEQRWTGDLGRLWNKTIDVILNIPIHNIHQSAFEITTPIMDVKATLYLKFPESTDVPLNFDAIFSKYIWVYMIFLIIITPLVFTFMRVILDGHNWKRHISDDYLRVWKIFCRMEFSDSHPTSSSLRLAQFSVYISASILTSVYAGCFTSFAVTYSLPFNDLRGFVADGSYKLILLKHDPSKEFILTSDDPLYREMGLLLKDQENLPSNIQEAFDQICSERTVLYLASYIPYRVMRPKPCKMVAIPLNTLRHMGIGLRRGDPLLGFFNYYLQKFKENGMLTLLKYREKEINDSEFKEQENPVYAFSMQNVFVLFIIFMIGLGISLGILFIECLYNKFKPIKIKKAESSRKRKMSPLHENRRDPSPPPFPFIL